MRAPTKRVRMTKQQQLQLCAKSELCPQMSNSQLAKWAELEFQLPKCPVKSTILNVLHTSDHLRGLSSDCLARKEFRAPHLLEREALTAEFIAHCELQQMPISGGVIVSYAKGIAVELPVPANKRPQFTCTGWLRHFLKRHGIRRKRAHGESSSVDTAAVTEQLPRLRNEIKKYHPHDVFNMDETAFYYMAVPRASICLNKAPALKQNKARPTVAVTANADGSEKLPLLFLGKASCPRWLHEKPPEVEYAGTSKGWMTVRIFQDWLVALDDKMGKAGRKILLLLDNAPVHIVRDVSLQNVRVLILPPNTTAAIQPMDQGVIAYVKQGVMSMKSDAALYRLLDGDSEPYKVKLVDAIHWLQINSGLGDSGIVDLPCSRDCVFTSDLSIGYAHTRACMLGIGTNVPFANSPQSTSTTVPQAHSQDPMAAPAIPSTFKAYQYENYGNPLEELKLRGNVDQPALEATQVRIKVHSAALNPVDYMLVEGFGRTLTSAAPSATNPFRIGFDAAGTVVEVGSSVSSGLKVGDAVYAMTPFSNFGTFAEYINIDEKHVAVKPANLSFNQAASVPLAALTSYQGLFDHAKLSQGQRVLVLGGSSATGIFAVQIAKAVGAHVITTTSSRNAEFVKSLGADQVVDYTSQKWVDVIDPHSIDVIYDCGMEPNSWNDDAQTVLKKQTGQFVTLLPITDPIESKFGAKWVNMMVHPLAAHLNDLTELIEAGKVITPIDSVHPFENLVEGIKKLKTRRAVGKVVLQVASE